MVRKHPPEVRRRVVELWLDGNTYKDIYAETGASPASSSSIIDRTRKQVPDIDELRRLNIFLKNAGANLRDALKGAQFLDTLNQLNIQIDRIPACISLLDQYGEKAGEVLESGQRLRELETSQGKTYGDIIDDATKKAQQLQEMTTRLKNLRKEEETIKSSLPYLEHLKLLNGKMSSYNLTLQRVDGFIEHSIKLEKLGFTHEAGELLAYELANRGLNPQMAADKLASLLSEHGNLGTAIAKLQEEKNSLQTAIDTKNAQLDGLTSQLEEFASKKSQLEGKIKNLEITRGQEEKQIQRLKQENESVQASLSKAQTALTKVEEKLKRNRHLATFALLAEEPLSQLEPATVLEVSVGFIEALKEHVDANPELVSHPPMLQSKLEEITGILAVEHRLATRKPL